MPCSRIKFHDVVLLLFILFCSSSGYSSSTSTTPDSIKTALNFYPVISFLYGTDRKFEKGSYTADMAPDLVFGEAEMVLHLHYRRHGDRVLGWWRLRELGDSKTGLRNPHPLKPIDFAAPLRMKDQDETFIYIHGFSTTFEEGAKEAAQIAYDLQLPVLPLLYSWPSHGSVSLGDYRIDQSMVNRPETIGHLTAFLQKVLGSSHGGKIHLVGFSMGAYLLTRSLMELLVQGRDLSKIGSIIFISPDIDAQDFKNLYFPELKKALAGRLVFYVSGRDQALVLSSAFHGGKARLGQGGGKITTLEGATTIDATQSSLDCGICHGLSQINGVINDMYLSLHQGLPANKRLLDPYEQNGEKHYALFDDFHDIVTLEDHNFAVAGQVGTYLNTFKLIWLPDPGLEIAAGVDRGYLPREIELRWNIKTENLRPYLDTGLNFFDQGNNATAWAMHGGVGVEFAFDSGLGLGLEWDGVTELKSSSSVVTGSPLSSLLKNNGFPWSGFHLQLIQYFDFNKLLD